ncbi:type 2 isopentenyl-diphosphate Delta-isomerase [Bacillus solitudinis]|uniref:type 2 isopentenyl-diphosphate Delta-isomerase n=1 Tax=Bacillus solitudinis TaxID=2014074 RepID=UPI000C24BFA3|nr:type 2 isopentenyl-diphosphate Delta-isomerase [Bacillus solitudinis]
MSRAARKLDHINHALTTGQLRTHGFDDIRFVHNSVPEMKVDQVNISTRIGELFLGSPIFINAMTGGGGKKTEDINRQLSEVASVCKIGLAVGSQMSAIKNSDQKDSFKIARAVNPNGIIFANLGSEATVEQAQRAVTMLEANALQIHLNVIQELVMPEGDRDFKGMLKRIERIVAEINVPVIVKEVGYGMSKETAKVLTEVGVSIIDVGGFGGTNFSKIENERRARSLSFFNEWGIKTTSSIIEVSQSSGSLQIFASGGMQTGLDVAKALALGASAAGFAGYFLKILVEKGQEALIEEIDCIKDDIRFIMTALGTDTIKKLQDVPLVISGDTHHWCKQRGLEIDVYGKRIF